jgi:hypothetical protein
MVTGPEVSKVQDQVLIVMNGITKLFVGDIIERGGAGGGGGGAAGAPPPGKRRGAQGGGGSCGPP